MKRSPALSLLLAASAIVPTAGLYADYREDVLADNPVARWGLDYIAEGQTAGSGSAELPALVHGKLTTVPGPRPGAYPAFTGDNRAVVISHRNWLRVIDPGEKSPLDFDLGDTITLEAWVKPDGIGDNQQVYVVGKGRTTGTDTNQNYALRLRGLGGTARASFLFRDSRNRAGKEGEKDWHRWTTSSGFAPDSGWHHIAISYTFGKPESIRGYIDGAELKGNWDMGGPTELGPVVDDSELWIGTAVAGAATNTFKGAIDEVAIYRAAVPAKRLTSRFVFKNPISVIPAKDLPKGQVKVEILERLQKPKTDDLIAQANAGGDDSSTLGAPIDPVDASWSTAPDVLSDSYKDSAFAFSRVPSKYSEHGVKVDRSAPFMIRASAAITLPPGEHRLLVRSLSGARLAMDGNVIATTNFITRRYADNEPVPDQTALMLVSGLRMLPAGHSEALATVKGDGKEHVFTLEAFVGGKNLRPETGELAVSISTDGGPFRLLTPKLDGTPLQDQAWLAYSQEQQEKVLKLEAKRRRIAKEDAYWKSRHAKAREIALAKPAPAIPAVQSTTPVFNDVDRFIGERLEKADVAASPLLDDLAFLRRLTLDLAGVIPTPKEVADFLAAPESERRGKAIDRLLADSRWADAWMPYWQDLLAENPAILKATLNNTGPFRFWLHESLLDNKPMDRFVTELVSMEGSVHHGGPAGFGVASQNDVPMAAKAQILTSAFIASEMKCARCHDAPSHPFNQEDLFGIAAMLQRGAIKVPVTSSVPGLSPDSHVTVTLKTGTAVDPHWPLGEFPAEPLPGVLRNAKDSREQLAAILTDPRNGRFAEVMVNRIWKQLLGWGIVEPVDDWDIARPSHPDLLKWLAREFVANGYDLKHVTRLIVSSHAYQRTPTAEASKPRKIEARLFEAPSRRRMTAEQIVDSLFVAAGKTLDLEELNFDTDARRSVRDFSNFGRPERAWEMVPMSNERDRPALALPRAQTVVDAMTVYGWRESRVESRSTRDHDPNVLQPATLANGIMGARITRLSDDSAFTEIGVQKKPVEAIVEDLFTRVLTRKPTPEEVSAFTTALSKGFEHRLLPYDPKAAPRRAPSPRAISWSNHLHADATKIKLELERETRAGDPPTQRLTSDWREQMEDAVWALMLTPEFAFIP